MTYQNKRLGFNRKIAQVYLYIFLTALFFSVLCLPLTADAADPVSRLAGANRYETAADIAAQGWPNGADIAILAYGENFPDALSSVPLAQKLNAPILLTETNRLTPVTQDALQSRRVRQVIIVGGTGVVSATVERQLSDMGISYIRLAGLDRYATSVEIAKYMGSDSGQLIVTTGNDFPNALIISSYAGQKGIPILLADNQATDGLKSYLSGRNIQKTYLISTASDLPSSLIQLCPNPTLIQGADATDTNLKVLEKFDFDYTFDNVYLATDQAFADALSGSALAAKAGAPIVLLSKTADSRITEYLSAKSQNIRQFTVLGGEGAVTSALVQSYEDGLERFQSLSITAINAVQPLAVTAAAATPLVSSGRWTPFPDQRQVSLNAPWTVSFSADVHLRDFSYIVLTKSNQVIPVELTVEQNILTLTITDAQNYTANATYKLTILLKNGQGYYVYFDTYTGNSPASLKYQLQSPHFVFYSSDQDQSILQALAATLESNYTQIQADLHFRLEGLQRINIYPDQESYLAASGIYDWSAACSFIGAIQALSPRVLRYSFDDFAATLTHEATHNINARLNIITATTLPHWLDEGVACFESKTNSRPETISKYARKAAIPTFDQLENNYDVWPDLGGYELSYTIIEYFIQTYGYDKLSAVLRNYNNFEEITGVSLAVFEANWRSAVKAKYAAVPTVVIPLSFPSAPGLLRATRIGG
ncbi:MAG: cell wall-binding repeat-containing protein [Peptococcaceae bacterium]|jgi:putative cell wall-binding protein|nr:cell wall-binding repeat-containing protein [Peptococcaceae bacterium]